ncbi:ABC transporter permease [Nonomuraea sp. NPDC047897]|uniref:ABC transporter permease n=1 Tax=Nonomuraea sp. NPDC047897 TaxID=3364346 RepID=UPI003710170E
MTLAATYRLGTRLFWRDRAMLVASVVTPMGIGIGLPLLMRHVRADGAAAAAQLFPGTIAIMLAITAFMNINVALATRRDQLVLKRLRTTTLTDGQILVGQIASTVTQTVVVIALCTVTVRFVADVPFPANPLLFAGAAVVGSAVMATLGAAYTAAVPRAELSAAACMPVFLLCGVGAGAMGPILEVLPSWVGSLFGLLPTAGVVDAMRDGAVAGPAANLAGWTVVALVALRLWFRWEPRRS